MGIPNGPVSIEKMNAEKGKGNGLEGDKGCGYALKKSVFFKLK